MKKNVTKILSIALLSFTGYVNAATITWSNTNATVAPADTFSLDVIGTGFISNVDGGGVNISFDPNFLNVLSVTIDTVVWDFGPSGISTGIIDNVAGTVNGIMVNAISAIPTDFTVASIQFQQVGAGTSSALNITEYALNPWASGGSAINPAFVGGNVSLSAVPVPAAIWLFGSGIVAFSTLVRRKSRI
ncbi:MAG: cohesin domain-containing protein [Gammaproteobacteria bacterium]|nr:cohesin domain-containing protein [Gammaproteobacteria bacterium]